MFCSGLRGEMGPLGLTSVGAVREADAQVLCDRHPHYDILRVRLLRTLAAAVTTAPSAPF